MKIKVKRVRGGSMGDQRDYGLVAGSIWNYEDKPTTNQVSDTVGPVDRDEATIEAERGETVVGDINNDGMLEHFIVGGKRHFQGGTPLNVPDGSFVFSDTRALNIKNKDVLKNIFGVTASKGMTPAKVAKKFDLNQYNDLLLDPEADAMSKRTAQMMLDNNLKKLGQLALVQEGMKGFPDGIPDIALPLFGSDIASSQPSQQMMRRGGLVRAQSGKQTKAKEKSYINFLAEKLNAEGNPLGQLKQNISSGLDKAIAYSKAASTVLSDKLGLSGNEGKSREYVEGKAAFNKWKQEWDAALKSKNQNKLKELKNSGIKLAKTLESTDVPGSLGWNLSWLDPNTTRVSAGSDQGMIDDAADVIYNLISEYDDELKKADSPEYTQSKTNFNKWRQDWDAAVKSGNEAKLKELKSSGQKLAMILRGTDVPNSLGWNLSMLDPNTTKVSAGSQQGMVDDAADVIDNLISKYDDDVQKQLKIKNPYLGYSSEYKATMSNFDKWNKDWNAAVKSGDQAKIDELRLSGIKLAEILKGTNIKNSLGFNWSWLDPRTTTVSPGTEQGMVNDAADVINNTISEYDDNIKQQQVTKANKQKSKAALETANARIKFANDILADFEKNGHNTKYTAEDIKNARSILERFKPIAINNRYQSADASLPGYTVDIGTETGYFDPKTDSATVANIINEFPLQSINQVQAKEQEVKAEEQAHNAATDTTDYAATDTTVVVDPATGIVGQQPASQQSASQQPTSQQAVRTAPSYVPVYKRNDTEIADFLRAQGIEVTPQFIQSVKDQKIERNGGATTLAKYDGTQQSQTGKVYYNLTDQTIKDAAKQKGYDVTYPYSWYTGQPVIGRQARLLPSGIFTDATGPEPDIEQFRDYPGVTFAGGWDKVYPGGFDKFKKDIQLAKGNPSEASRTWVDKVVNPYSMHTTGLPVIDVNQEDAYKPGVRWSQNPVFNPIQAPAAVVTPPAQSAPVATVVKSTLGAVPTPTYSPTSYYQPWSNYSNVDVAAAMTNYFGVKRGDLPTLYHYAPNIPDPTFLDPARAIAQQQGLVAQSTEDIASRSMDPTTARANTIAAQAQSADPIANTQAKYDEANTQIANQFALQNANTLNEAQLRNIAFRDKYQTELQTLEQQYQNARREGRTEVAEAIKRAMVDQMQRGALNVQNPNYAIGPNGQIYFKPGYDIRTGKNIYADNSLPGESLLTRVMEQYDLNAKDAADVIKTLSGNKKRSVSKYGMTVSNPMDIIWG